MDFHSLLRKAKQGIEDFLPGEERHSHTHDGHECHEDDAHAEYGTNRYCSFAPQSSGHPKWYVDGASYFWAVSMALEGMYATTYAFASFTWRPPSHHTLLALTPRAQRLENTSTSWTGG